MILAVIDCGTNTFNLLIVEIVGSSYKKLFNNRISVKLGEGTINKGYIDKLPFERGIAALKDFKELLVKFNVTRTLAFATSAIRDAKNGIDFVLEAKKNLGLSIEIIDGNREAELIYMGNKVAAKVEENVVLIMDIGGGSTEFIIANGKKIFWKQSFLLGAARLLEKFELSDPITKNEMESIYSYLKQELNPLFEALKVFPSAELVGSSGAFDSIIEMIHGELEGEELVKEKICYEVKITDYYKISDLVIKSTIMERKQIKGLIPMRLDMIVVSSLLINFILQSFPINKFLVSTYSLKEGALIDYISKTTDK